MTIKITLNTGKELIVKNVNPYKLRALKSIHGESNIALVFDYTLSTLNW